MRTFLPGVDGRTWRFNCCDSFSLCTAELERIESPGRRCFSLLMVSFLLLGRLRNVSRFASVEALRQGV